MKAEKRRGVPFIFMLMFVGLAIGTTPALGRGATISGTVTFAGTPPPPKTKKVEKDVQKCGTEQVSEQLVVGNNKGIQYVVVSIVNAPPGKTSAGRAELDQHGCRFQPHVVVMPVRAKLIVRNRDGIMHNLHTFSKINPSINKAQPGFKKKMIIRTLKKPEIVRVRCDIHGWMGGWIVVSDTPYTVVTNAAGRFQLPDVPAGTYTLKFWHETLGETTREVTVQDGAKATVDVSMGLS